MPDNKRMTTRLKELFERPEIFVIPGGMNPMGAKMAELLGFEAFYMSGGNTSAHVLGLTEGGTSMRDMVDNARRITILPTGEVGNPRSSGLDSRGSSGNRRGGGGRRAGRQGRWCS